MYIGVSDQSIDKPDLFQQLEWLVEHEFEEVEILCTPTDPPERGTIWRMERSLDDRVVERLKRLLSSFKMVDVHAGFHAWFDPTFVGYHPLCWKIAMDDICFDIKLASILQAKVVTIHTGWLSYGRTKKERLESTRSALSELNKVAGKHNVVLGIEVVDYFSSVDRFTLLEEMSLENVGITLDPAHMMRKNPGMPVDPIDVLPCRIYGSIGGFIERFAEKIVHVHLHDFDGKEAHTLIGTGMVDFDDVITTLKKIGYDGALTFEYNYGIFPEAVLKSRVLLREWLGESKD